MTGCQCTCEAWGHPGVCNNSTPCTLTAGPRDPSLDLWPAANVGEFRLCWPCYHALRKLIDRIQPWVMNMEAFGYPTLGMLEQAEIERLSSR